MSKEDKCRLEMACRLCLLHLCLWAPGVPIPCVSKVADLEEVPSGPIVTKLEHCPFNSTGIVSHQVDSGPPDDGHLGKLIGWQLGFGSFGIILIVSVYFKSKKLRMALYLRRRYGYIELVNMEYEEEMRTLL